MGKKKRRNRKEWEREEKNWQAAKVFRTDETNNKFNNQVLSLPLL